MKIVVTSCDKNADTWYPFHHCMEKYWPNHPKVVYSTETKVNPYYTTVCKDIPVSAWTRRMRETLETIRDKEVLLIVDDAFIRRPVDVARVATAIDTMKKDNTIACINFEKMYDLAVQDLGYEGFFLRQHGAPWEVSIQCGLWDRKKLIDVLEGDMDPWAVERLQPSKGYTYLINNGDYIIDYGYVTHQVFGITNGRWCKEVVPFFEKEGIEVDYSRGFNP